MLGLSRATWRSLGGLALILVVGLVWTWAGGGSGSNPGPGSDPSASTSPGSSSVASTSPRARPTSPGGSAASGSGAARTDPASGLPWIAVSALPAQAREVLADIDAGGPFDYPGKDGSTFGNFERVLPEHKRGYYREYTVETPGVSHRGARRIVTGSAGEFYWTADHYENFSRIRR